MMTWNDYLAFLTRSISLILFCSILTGFEVKAQETNSYLKFVPAQYEIYQDTNRIAQNYPDPKKVLYRSLMIPGWGQITNKQIWKVPIVYGLLGGLSYYSYWLHNNYKDYRAAFYNLNPNTPDDFKFGPTPAYISENTDLELLRENRNFYRNRRDFVFITIGLAYALNVIDAYVFAHLRSFDVSDDLAMDASINSDVMKTALNQPLHPAISVSVKLHFK